jgi:chromate reductase
MTSEPLDVLGICGSLRSGSFNAAVLRTLPELCPANMTLSAHSGGIGDFPLYNADVQSGSGFPAAVTALADAIRAADGLVIVSPEYNYSVPGVLKNALDWVSRVPEQPLKNKPVLIQSASPGFLGGVRMQYHLRQIMVFLDAIVFTRPEVIISSAADRIKDGRLVDETTRNLVAKQLEAFGHFIVRVRS